MKKLLFVVVALLGSFSIASAQCGDDLMKVALAAMGDKQYIKDFDIKLDAGKDATYPIVLNSRTKYQINVANGASNSENIIIEISDGTKAIGTNFANGKAYVAFQFVCSKTGAYKFIVSTNGKTAACARAVLSLVAQLSEAEMP